MKHINIVVSNPDTIVARIIRKLTGDNYTHASIAFDDSLDTMYSFGRVFPNNPFIGGFVKESPHYGTMKKFCTANIVVIQLTVRNDQYKEINEYIKTMYTQRKKYHYNYLGLFVAKFGWHFHRDNYYYCSEFVKDILERFNIVETENFNRAVRPVELLNVQGGKVIYQGKLCEYARA